MEFSKENIVNLLESCGSEEDDLFKLSNKVKIANVGNYIWLRGLIEYSNRCLKNCLYCGIRVENSSIERYVLSDDEVLNAARYAYGKGMGSVVIQAGENVSGKYILRVEKLISQIKRLSDNKLGITISLGEQTRDTYLRWYEAGADRYLLRIEASNESLYNKIHPSGHSYKKRRDALLALKVIGYQVGTGVMIGLPFQTSEHLAEDLLFMRELDIDMCGMGPYIEHPDTPLFAFRDELKPLEQRAEMTLKMIAVLRLMMPDINIAATTALRAVSPDIQRKALEVGANVVMPNITPVEYRDNYKLYDNKPLESRDLLEGLNIGRFEQGNSLRFQKRNRK